MSDRSALARTPLSAGQWLIAVALISVMASSACTAPDSRTATARSAPASAAPATFHVAGDDLCNGTVCISVSKLRASVVTSLTGNVVGGIALIGDTQPFTTGYARRPGDKPVLAMNASVPVNTGSIGKLYTTIAVLQWMDRRGVSLNAPIAPYLPRDWAIGPNVQSITFGRLLSHRAGFRVPTTRVFESRSAAREQIAVGINSVDQQIAQYNNIDFTIFEDLAPRMESEPAANDSAAVHGAGADRWYQQWIQRHVFDPVGVHDATCNGSAATLLAYPPLAAGTSHGSQTTKAPSGCSAGGWMMTAASIQRVLAGLLQGTLLSTKQRQAMDRDCLGWDCSILEQINYRGKDGLITTTRGDAALVAFAGIVAGNLPVVMAANSLPPETWFRITRDAISSATTTVDAHATHT